jgi:hypothetical protein
MCLLACFLCLLFSKVNFVDSCGFLNDRHKLIIMHEGVCNNATLTHSVLQGYGICNRNRSPHC